MRGQSTSYSTLLTRVCTCVLNVTAKVILHYESLMGEKRHLLRYKMKAPYVKILMYGWRLLPAEIASDLQIFIVIQGQGCFSSVHWKAVTSSKTANSDLTLFTLPTTTIFSFPLDERVANWALSTSAVHHQSVSS